MFINIASAPVALASPGTVTVAASVGGVASVVTKAAHGLLAGTPLSFAAATTMPAGMVSGEEYFVAAGATLLTNSFTLVDEQGNPVVATSTGVGTITATATDFILKANVSQARVFGCEVKNIGANPLDVFDVYGRFSEVGNLIKLATLATDYSNAVYPITKAGGAPVTLASAATAWFFMDVTGLFEVILRASSSTGATSLELHASSKFVA